ncbi:MAG: SulP family inorganic anion transporter, partial [Rhodobacterales bacterium]|nr:SulP family inorganic anion transporter [Rhodobacterales bacterium]
MAGLLVILFSVSFSTLVFSGAAAPGVAAGYGMALYSGLILCLTMAAFSTYPGMVAGPDTSLAILALAAASLAAALGPDVAPEALVPLVVAGATASTGVIGLVLFLLGQFRLGNLVRYVPFPVVGGFLAGVGWLLVGGGVRTMTDLPLEWAALPGLLAPGELPKWLPGAAIGLALALGVREGRHARTIPAVLVVVIAAFWALAWALGADLRDLREGAWLLGPFPKDGLGDPFQHLGALAGADWSLLAHEVPKLGTLVMLVLVGLLLTGTSLELITRTDIDLNRELKVAGLGNLLSALGGGLPGYQYLGTTSVVHQMGAPRRLVGVVAAGVIGATLLFGYQALSFLPRLVPGILLMFMGFSFLTTWLVFAWRTLSRAEYGVVVLVFAVVVLFGFMEGVAAGIVAGVVLFVVNYSRVNVIRFAVDGAAYHANVDRTEAARAVLAEHGPGTLILGLQGFIFFGTANRLVRRVSQHLRDPSAAPLTNLVLDFRRVSGLDSSAAASFNRLAQYATRYGFRIVGTGLAPDARDRLKRAGIRRERRMWEDRRGRHRDGDGNGDRRTGADRRVRDVIEVQRMIFFPDLDRGLEWCEEALLRAHWPGGAEPAEPLAEQLRRSFPPSVDVARFIEYLAVEDYAPDDALIHQGDDAKDIF